MRVSMRQMARQLDVSVSTVSRALKEDPRVKAETRDRILQLAKQMDYAPDPALASLNAYRLDRTRQSYHGTLAWITNYSTPDGWRCEKTNATLYDFIQEIAPSYGYQVEAFWLHPKNLSPSRLDKILQARRIQGIFLPILPEGTDRVDMPWENYSTLSFSETVQYPVTHNVQKGAHRDIRTAVRELAKLGYQRPTFLVHDRYATGMHNAHLGAFIAATTEYLSCERPCLHCHQSEFEAQLPKFIKTTKPDAIISTMNPPLSLLKKARRPPWITITGFMEPHVDAAIVHDLRAVVKTGLEFMIGRLQRTDLGLPEHPIGMELKGRWEVADGGLLM